MLPMLMNVKFIEDSYINPLTSKLVTVTVTVSYDDRIISTRNRPYTILKS